MTIRSLAKMLGCSGLKVEKRNESRVVIGTTADNRNLTLAFLTKKTGTEGFEDFPVWEFTSNDGRVLNGCGQSQNFEVLAQATV